MSSRKFWVIPQELLTSDKLPSLIWKLFVDFFQGEQQEQTRLGGSAHWSTSKYLRRASQFERKFRNLRQRRTSEHYPICKKNNKGSRSLILVGDYVTWTWFGAARTIFNDTDLFPHRSASSSKGDRDLREETTALRSASHLVRHPVSTKHNREKTYTEQQHRFRTKTTMKLEAPLASTYRSGLTWTNFSQTQHGNNILTWCVARHLSFFRHVGWRNIGTFNNVYTKLNAIGTPWQTPAGNLAAPRPTIIKLKKIQLLLAVLPRKWASAPPLAAAAALPPHNRPARLTFDPRDSCKGGCWDRAPAHPCTWGTLETTTRSCRRTETTGLPAQRTYCWADTNCLGVPYERCRWAEGLQVAAKAEVVSVARISTW